MRALLGGRLEIEFHRPKPLWAARRNPGQGPPPLRRIFPSKRHPAGGQCANRPDNVGAFVHFKVLRSVGFRGCGKTHRARHAEERSEEESLFLWTLNEEGFLTSFGMTTKGTFFIICLARAPLALGTKGVQLNAL